MKTDVVEYFKTMLKKRNLTLDSLNLDISEEVKQKLISSPEKLSGKVIGKIFKKINITAKEYLEFTLLIHPVPGRELSQAELNWIGDCELYLSKDKLEIFELSKLINQLLKSRDIIENLSYSDLFKYHQKFSSYISKHLKSELNLNAPATLESEVENLQKKYFSLPQKIRQEKFRMFISYFQHILEVRDKEVLLNDKVTSLKAYLKKYEWEIPDQDNIYKLLSQKDVYIEAYDKNFIQIYRSPDFATITNHSIMKLETYEWRELFQRSKEDSLIQQKIISKLFSGEVKEPIYNPMGKHCVKEINSISPRSAEVESLSYCPIYSSKDILQGGLHIFKYKTISSAAIH